MLLPGDLCVGQEIPELFSSGMDRNIKKWELGTKFNPDAIYCNDEYTGYIATVISAVFAAEHSLLMTGSEDGGVLSCHVLFARLMVSFALRGNLTMCLCFAFVRVHGLQNATAIRVWEYATGRKRLDIDSVGASATPRPFAGLLFRLVVPPRMFLMVRRAEYLPDKFELLGHAERVTGLTVPKADVVQGDLAVLISVSWDQTVSRQCRRSPTQQSAYPCFFSSAPLVDRRKMGSTTAD